MITSLKPLLLFFAAAILSLPLAAERDRHDERGRPETGRVVLYSGENFDGVSVELLPGARIGDLGDLRFSDGRKVADRISSVRIIGDLKVTLFEDSGFRGESLELDRSVGHLKRIPRRRGGGSWDNRVSSVLVSGGRPDLRDDNRGREHSGEGADRDRPRRNDGLSPAEIERMVVRAYQELLDREPNRDEVRRYCERVFSEGWGRAEIVDAIRGSREYRLREAERIVVRTYRDLLGRDPDPSGLHFWSKTITDKGWSEERFRSEIRESDEFRRRGGDRGSRPR